MRKLTLFLYILTALTFSVSGQNRPQTPYPPYPYDTLDITITNPTANIVLEGTLTSPKKSKALIVMATGSGSQNRDEEIFAHRPFKVIADFLSRNEYSVFRMDDRGVGKSNGDPSIATTDDFASDILSAINHFRNDDKMKNLPIGIIGHSEGGSIAIKLSSNVDFIVTLAAPALPGDSIILTQAKSIIVKNDESAWQELYPTLRQRYNMVISEMPTTLLNINLYSDVTKDMPQALLTEQMKSQIWNEIHVMSSPWYRNLLRYNPTEDIKNVMVPWLALNGMKDTQVICEENISAIRHLNPNATIQTFENLNHLFQECTTGMPEEYIQISQTISPIVLQSILNWLNKTL